MGQDSFGDEFILFKQPKATIDNKYTIWNNFKNEKEGDLFFDFLVSSLMVDFHKVDHFAIGDYES